MYTDYLSTITACPLCEEADLVIGSSEYHSIVAAKAPYAKNHIMILPKEHIVSITHYTSEQYNDLMGTQVKMTQFLYDLGHTYISWLLRDSLFDNTTGVVRGEGYGKSLTHLHMHCIPDCNIVARHLADPKASDARKVITGQDVSALRDAWGGRD